MQLDDRKLKILQAIIRNYLETGEPVGSRTISKYTDLNLSSATIRNEMSDLEEYGYILQPHTSAGRIPSDKGYRLYVDTMMQDKIQEVEEMTELLNQKTDKIEHLLKSVAKLLAVNTNYATMVTTPKYKHKKIKFIQLTEVDQTHILAIIVIEGNIVKNKMIDSCISINKENMLRLNILLNTFLNGLDITQINLTVIQRMKEQAGEHVELVDLVLEAIAEAFKEEEELEIYTSGATNILKYPELSDMESATGLLSAFEEKKLLTDMINDNFNKRDNKNIQVYIGNETEVTTMKDCSVVTATYEIEEGVTGTIGIVGPKRMDYEKVVSTLQTLMVQLDEIFKKKT